MSTSLYVGNLSFKVGEEDLYQLFVSQGEVVSTKIIRDRETGRPRGFAFVEMAVEEDAEKAIQNLNGQDFMGRTLKVNLARPRTDRRPEGRRPPGQGRGARR